LFFLSDTGELEVHNLQETGSYKLLYPDENNRYWLAEMGLFIGVWQGKRENRQGYWLRWWDQDGNLLLWGSELVQQERLAKEAALKRLEELEKRLRDAGISD
jgi:hypothetical protein